MEVELGAGAVEDDGGSVVGSGGVLGGGEGAEPAASPFAGLADLRHPFSPAPLPHAPVLELAVLRPALAFAFSCACDGGCSGGFCGKGTGFVLGGVVMA